MNTVELKTTALALVPAGKGILAADESTGTITKRLQSVGVASTDETRRAYRDMLFATPGVEHFISGVILYDETIRKSLLDPTTDEKTALTSLARFSETLGNWGIKHQRKIATAGWMMSEWFIDFWWTDTEYTVVHQHKLSDWIDGWEE